MAKRGRPRQSAAALASRGSKYAKQRRTEETARVKRPAAQKLKAIRLDAETEGELIAKQPAVVSIFATNKGKRQCKVSIQIADRQPSRATIPADTIGLTVLESARLAAGEVLIVTADGPVSVSGYADIG